VPFTLIVALISLEERGDRMWMFLRNTRKDRNGAPRSSQDELRAGKEWE